MAVLHQEYYAPIVFLSFGISFIGAYVGISLAEIFRVKVMDTCKNSLDQGFVHYFYLFLMALSIGGVAIWSMHFIGMQAVSIHNASNDAIGMRFNFGLSIASLIAVVFTVFVGLVIASRDRMFCKTKAEIIDMFMTDAKKLSIAEIRKITATKMLILIATKELGTLVFGGVMTSAGVCIMHYIGMESMQFDGIIRWNIGLVVLSIVIAVVASSAAFWILFRLLSIFPEMEWLRSASAFVMALAVNGMHYTGMGAAKFMTVSNPSDAHGADLMGASMARSRSFLAVLIAANVAVWLLAHIAFSASRESVNVKSRRLRESQEVIRRLAEATSHLPVSTATTLQRVIEHYTKKEQKRKEEEEAKALASISYTLFVYFRRLFRRAGILPISSDTHGDGVSIMSNHDSNSGVFSMSPSKQGGSSVQSKHTNKVSQTDHSANNNHNHNSGENHPPGPVDFKERKEEPSSALAHGLRAVTTAPLTAEDPPTEKVSPPEMV